MKSPRGTALKSFGECIKNLISKISGPARAAFIASLAAGLLTHMSVMVSDLPNHDGLGSLYFDQNMITSGRWFLSAACGISSYFALPWLIGVLALIYIAISSLLTVQVLELKSRISGAVVGALMAVFPALASTFAYVFTMDGYMLGLLMGVAAVFVTKRFKFGWIPGAVLLALSLGCYQAYLPVVMLLCMIDAIMTATDRPSKDSFKGILRYLYMGVIGGGLYFLILQIMLKIQGKTLGTYQLAGSAATASQGASVTAQVTNGLDAASQASGITGILGKVLSMYRDFAVFSLKSRVLSPNAFTWIALICIAVGAAVSFVIIIIKKKLYKSPLLYIIAAAFVICVPFASNVIMLISSDLTYHALMRYQWVMIPIFYVTMMDRFGGKIVSWIIAIAGAVLVLVYSVTDNIGYSNLQKKYERTYAYCVRLLDRIEQTEGYYQGIPVAMIGVVSTDQYPKADLTSGVTDNLIGLSGDYLLYKNLDYQLFIKNYLGADLNMISGDEITEIYNSEEYILMDSFPAESSVKLVDGVIYVKTENIDHELRQALGTGK